MEPTPATPIYAGEPQTGESKKARYIKYVLSAFVALGICAALAWFLWYVPAQKEREIDVGLYSVQQATDRSDFNSALSQIDNLLTTYPNNSKLLAANSLVLSRKAARTFDTETLGPMAAAVAEQAIESNPKNSDAYHARGLAYEIQGQYDKAHEQYAKALALNPENARAIYSEAHTYHLQGDLAKAEAGYLSVIKKDPNFAAAYLNMARIFAYKGDANGMQKMLAQGFNLSVDSGLKASAAYSMAALYFARNDLESANHYADQAIALNSTYPLGWYMKGKIAYQDSLDKNKYSSADERRAKAQNAVFYLKRAINLNGNQSIAYVELGKALFALGEENEAKKIYAVGLATIEKDMSLGVLEKEKVQNSFAEARRSYLETQ